MAIELQVTDAVWHQIQSVLTTVKPKSGRPPNQDDRMFIEAVLYGAKNGIPWRALPAEFGNWSAVYNRLKRWKNNGTWEQLWQKLETDNLSSFPNCFIDSTCVRVHQHAAGAPKKKGGQTDQAIGRSRGGLTTKIHLLCLSETRGIGIILTPGQTHDVKGFDSLFESLPDTHLIQSAVMDKAYDSDSVRAVLEAAEIEAVIPPKQNRTEAISYDEALYKQRNKVERFINRLKQFRRIATRYDKLADTFLAFIQIVAVYIAVA